MNGDIKTLLLLPHINVHNANALSSPFTIGFPAMTAWLGAVHALQRQLNNDGISVGFDAVGVVSHDIDLQTHRGDGDFVSSIVGTANPLDKSGARSAFIEEARCHLDVSLIIECSGVDKDEEEKLKSRLSHRLHATMKMAGGDIRTFRQPVIMRIEDGNAKDISRLTRQLMPGYVLIERRDLMVAAMRETPNGDKPDAIDAMLDFLAVHHSCELDDEGKVIWHSHRRQVDGESAGWVVPVATGFHGISELGEAKNQRDPDTLHRFAESVVTLGEFKMPYHFRSVDELLWRYYVDTENALYLCQQGDGKGSVDDSIEHSIENEFY